MLQGYLLTIRGITMYDIVYVLQDHPPTEELRYSLRSLVNFPHRDVWFVCGVPDGIKPDHQIRHEQRGASNWQKSTSSVYLACQNKNITDDFWLFNDDFFVMKPVKNMKPIYNGTLYRRIQELEQKNLGKTLYSRELERVYNILMDDGYGTLNYAVHMPMLINKKKALAVINQYPDAPSFRSLYGNVCKVGGVNRKDVKVLSHTEVPKGKTFLSTTDTAFRDGKVGEYIRECFPEQSRFEI